MRSKIFFAIILSILPVSVFAATVVGSFLNFGAVRPKTTLEELKDMLETSLRKEFDASEKMRQELIKGSGMIVEKEQGLCYNWIKSSGMYGHARVETFMKIQELNGPKENLFIVGSLNIGEINPNVPKTGECVVRRPLPLAPNKRFEKACCGKVSEDKKTCLGKEVQKGNSDVYMAFDTDFELNQKCNNSPANNPGSDEYINNYIQGRAPAEENF
jgi:hypothetical protein